MRMTGSTMSASAQCWGDESNFRHPLFRSGWGSETLTDGCSIAALSHRTIRIL